MSKMPFFRDMNKSDTTYQEKLKVICHNSWSMLSSLIKKKRFCIFLFFKEVFVNYHIFWVFIKPQCKVLNIRSICRLPWLFLWKISSYNSWPRSQSMPSLFPGTQISQPLLLLPRVSISRKSRPGRHRARPPIWDEGTLIITSNINACSYFKDKIEKNQRTTEYRMGWKRLISFLSWSTVWTSIEGSLTNMSP